MNTRTEYFNAIRAPKVLDVAELSAYLNRPQDHDRWQWETLPENAEYMADRIARYNGTDTDNDNNGNDLPPIIVPGDDIKRIAQASRAWRPWHPETAYTDVLPEQGTAIDLGKVTAPGRMHANIAQAPVVHKACTLAHKHDWNTCEHVVVGVTARRGKGDLKPARVLATVETLAEKLSDFESLSAIRRRDLANRVARLSPETWNLLVLRVPKVTEYVRVANQAKAELHAKRLATTAPRDNDD